MRTQALPYQHAGVELEATLVWPQPGEHDPAGILVVHGGAGLDAHARDQATRFARRGFAALACDMYGVGVAGDRTRVLTVIERLRSDVTLMRARAAAALDLLAERVGGRTRCAVIGYCFGGRVALELARGGIELAAAVSVHGSLATSAPAAPEAIRTPILVCHGAADPHVPMSQVIEFAAEMEAARAEWEMSIYGQAEHGFTHRGAPAAPGVAYHPTADARSFETVIGFLSAAFGSSAPLQ